MSLADLGTLVVEKIQSRFGLTTRGLRKALTQYDLDKNGLLDVSEISKVFSNMLIGVPSHQINALAKAFDRDNDGKISVEELQETIMEISRGEGQFLREKDTPKNDIDEVQRLKNSFKEKKSNPQFSTPSSQHYQDGDDNISCEFYEDYEAQDYYDDADELSFHSENYQSPRNYPNSRESYRDNYRDDYRRNPRDNYRENPRDDYRRTPRDDYREITRDDYRRTPRDDYRDNPRDDYRENRASSRESYRNVRDSTKTNYQGYQSNQREVQSNYRENPRDNQNNIVNSKDKMLYQDTTSRIFPGSEEKIKPNPPVPTAATIKHDLIILQGEIKNFLISFNNFIQVETLKMVKTGRFKNELISLSKLNREKYICNLFLKKKFGNYFQDINMVRKKNNPNEFTHGLTHVGVKRNDFINVILSIQFPGEDGLTLDGCEFLFSLCEIDNTGLASLASFMALLYGTTDSKSYVEQLNSERSSVQRGPLVKSDPVENSKQFNTDAPVPQENEVPLRLVSKRVNSNLLLPNRQNYNDLKTSNLPQYELKRRFVFGLSRTRYSGQALYVVPPPPTNLGTALPPPKLAYFSAGMGIVYDFDNHTSNSRENPQTIPCLHDDDITCLALAPDGVLAATGCMGKFPVVKVWFTNPNLRKNYREEIIRPEDDNDEKLTGNGEILTLGHGFFERAVCCVQFSYDNKFLFTVSCDDYHTIGIFDLKKGDLVCQSPCLQGIPGQVKWLTTCPALTTSQFITKEHPQPCDLFVTAGERHLKYWSFRRPSHGLPASIYSKGAVQGKKSVNSSDIPKVFTCASFLSCPNETFDLIAGGENGFLGSYRDGKLNFHQIIFKNGSINCLQIVSDKIIVGGFYKTAPGTSNIRGDRVIKIIDSRTLNVLRDFNLGHSGPSNPVPSRAQSASRPRITSTSGRPSTASSINSSRSSSSKNITTARPRTPPPPSHAAGYVSKKDDKFSLNYEDKKVLVNPSEEETGSNAITSINVVVGHGRGGSGSTYIVASLGSGRVVKLDVGNILSDNVAAKPEYLVNDLMWFHTGPVYGLTGQSENGPSVMITTGDDRQLFVWDINAMAPLARNTLKTVSRSCHLDNTSQFVIVGSTSGTITIFYIALSVYNKNPRVRNYLLNKLDTLPEVAFRKDSQVEITCLKFSPSNQRIAAGSRDDSIYIYTFRHETPSANSVPKVTLTALHKLKGHSSTICHFDWTIDSKRLYSSSQAYETLVWDPESGRRSAQQSSDPALATHTCPSSLTLGAWPPYTHGSDINTFDVNVNKKLLLTSMDQGGFVRLLSWPCVVKNSPARCYPGHSSHCQAARFFNEGQWVGSIGGNDGSVVIWEVKPIITNSDSFR